jgi:CheY-like chemotaxis protein
MEQPVPMTCYKDRWTPYRVDFAGYSVHVVDDDPVARRTLVQALRTIGFFRIAQASDGAAALDILSGDAFFDVVLSDIAMKPMDGVAFLERVRHQGTARFHDVPVLFVSGHGDIPTVANAVRLRPAGYVLKPARPEQLSQRLAITLGLTTAPAATH